jgi:RHS repeat-associated protein
MTQVTDSGGGVMTYTYDRNNVYISVGPAPPGENEKRRQMEFDGLGRLSSVCEVTSATGWGSCQQTTSRDGYWTVYGYDTLGSLTSVKQNKQAIVEDQQTRSFSYDMLGRMLSETNPESGTTNYSYDSAGGCSGSFPGDLVKKQDQRGNVTCFTYDALRRITSITYPSGPDIAVTPMKMFYWDAPYSNPSTTNTKGRLASAGTCLNPTCAGNWYTLLDFSYSDRGEVTDYWQKTPNSGGTYHVTNQYWANGALQSISGIPGLPTITYGINGEGRTNAVSASSGQNPVTGVTYNVAGQRTAVTFGSLDSDAFTYDPNTGRLTQYKFTVNSQNVIGDLGWNANGSLATVAITDAFNPANTQTCNYSHDDLSRVKSVDCGTTWYQAFGYDPFGNIKKTTRLGSGGWAFTPQYSTQTNQVTDFPSGGYDANGNLTNDGTYTFTWDVDGKARTLTSGSTVTATYDALGRMVEKSVGGTNTQMLYGPNGNKLVLMNGATLSVAYVPLPGGGTAVYYSSGLSHYRHADWLGSSRFASTPSRTMHSSLAYAPFGEPYSEAGASGRSFTGQDEHTMSGLYDFMFRRYNRNQGRWISPDPAGLAAVNLGGPQSWNRYAYVLNNPLTLIDPLGLQEKPCKDGVCGDGGGGSGEGIPGGCSADQPCHGGPGGGAGGEGVGGFDRGGFVPAGAQTRMEGDCIVFVTDFETSAHETYWCPLDPWGKDIVRLEPDPRALSPGQRAKVEALIDQLQECPEFKQVGDGLQKKLNNNQILYTESLPSWAGAVTYSNFARSITMLGPDGFNTSTLVHEWVHGTQIVGNPISPLLQLGNWLQSKVSALSGRAPQGFLDTSADNVAQKVLSTCGIQE